MSQRIRQLMIQFDASVAAAQREMLKLANDVDRESGKIEDSAGKAARALERIGDGAASGADGLEFLKGAAKGALAVLSVDRLIQMGTALATVNGQFQVMEARLRVATGSVAAASSKMAELEQFAAKTPFTLDQVVDGFLKLQNLGLDPSTEALRDYGNVAAASGKSVMDFIEAVADASVGEFERLKEFGIKARSEGDQVIFTFRGIETTVAKSSGAIQGYLRGIATEVGDGMGAQMDTIAGKISNLDDAFRRLQVTIGKLGFNKPFVQMVDRLTRGLEGVSLEAQGHNRIAKYEGTLAAWNYTGAERVEAGTAEGYRTLLARQANQAKSTRIRAEQGEFSIHPIYRLRQNEQRLLTLLEKFERDNNVTFGLDPMSQMFPLNDRGRFGTVPRPTGGGGGGGGGGGRAGRSVTAPSSFTLANDEFGWATRLPDNMLAALPAARADVAAIYRELEAMGELPPIQPIDREAVALIDDFSQTLGQTLGLAIANGQSFWGAMQAGLRNFLAQAAVGGFTDLIGGLFGRAPTSIFGGLLGGLFGGRRSSGGPAEPGVPYLVGENKPEIFIPTSRGRIAPNPAMGGGGGGQTVDVTVRTEPNALFVQTVDVVTRSAARDEVGGQLARAGRPRARGSFGA